MRCCSPRKYLLHAVIQLMGVSVASSSIQVSVPNRLNTFELGGSVSVTCNHSCTQGVGGINPGIILQLPDVDVLFFLNKPIQYNILRNELRNELQDLDPVGISRHDDGSCRNGTRHFSLELSAIHNTRLDGATAHCYVQDQSRQYHYAAGVAFLLLRTPAAPTTTATTTTTTATTIATTAAATAATTTAAAAAATSIAFPIPTSTSTATATMLLSTLTTPSTPPMPATFSTPTTVAETRPSVSTNAAVAASVAIGSGVGIGVACLTLGLLLGALATRLVAKIGKSEPERADSAEGMRNPNYLVKSSSGTMPRSPDWPLTPLSPGPTTTLLTPPPAAAPPAQKTSGEANGGGSSTSSSSQYCPPTSS